MEGFGITVDWLAPIFIGILCLILLLGTAEGAMVQNISMAVYLTLISFIVIAGGSQVNRENYTPYFPYGATGVFFGVSSIFFSFVGFDMVASLAEEAVNPQVDLPIGIVGSIGAATAIYVAMSTVLVGMVSYLDLDTSAPFSSMFEAIGWGWAAKIVSVGAVIGCTNSNYGGLLGQSRIFVTMSRAGLLPKFLSKMSSRQVPYWSIIFTGLLASIIAVFVDLSELWDLVSMGTLISFGVVCIGTIWRRYSSKGFVMPLMPWIPASGVMVNGFLIGLLGENSFVFWGAWMGVCVLIYLFYGLHNTQGQGSSGEVQKEIESSEGSVGFADKQGLEDPKHEISLV